MGEDVGPLSNHDVRTGAGDVDSNSSRGILPNVTRDGDIARPGTLVNHPIYRVAVRGGVRPCGSDPPFPGFLKKHDVSSVHERIKYGVSYVVSFIYVERKEGYARE